MSEKENLAKNLSKSNSAFAPEPGCAVLPKSRLSLWAAVLALIGAIGLLGYQFGDPFFAAPLKYLKVPANALGLLEALSLLIAAILLFTARASGKSLKAPILVWTAGTLFGLPFTVYSFLQYVHQYFLPMAYCTLLMKAVPVIAALFAILYAFKALKKLPSLIIIGVLLGAVFIAGTYFYFTALLDYPNHPFSPFVYINCGLILLYYLLFPTGLFLTVLASKPKAAE